jgi:hypothetical protein
MIEVVTLESDIEKVARDTAIAFLNKKYPSAHPLNWSPKLINTIINTIESDIPTAYIFETHIPVPDDRVTVYYEKETKSFYAC